MRISICGSNRRNSIKRIENALGVESINIDFPGMDDNEYKLFNYAAETFKYYNKKNVIFDGGVFDVFRFYTDLGWAELQEQVILSAIANLDKIVIIIEGMDDKRVEFCKSFADLYPEKILMISNENEFDIR